MSTEAGPKPKKGLPWGLPIFLLLMFSLLGIGISMFASSVYAERTALEWLVAFVMRLLGPIIIIGIAAALLRNNNKKPADH